MKDPKETTVDDGDRTKRVGIGAFAGRIMKAVSGGVALLIRQSSDYQKLHNKGSAEYQHNQMQFLKPYGVCEEKVVIFDARGESGTGRKPRPVFADLIKRVWLGEIRVVVVAFADRFSRGDKALGSLYDALESVGGFVVVGGHFYELADPTHRMILGILDGLAKFENTQKSLLFGTARMALAGKLAHRLKLPRGYTWGCPSDPDFVQAMAGARLAHLITKKALKKHETNAVDGQNRPVFVLPFPDRAVYDALQMTRNCLLKTGKVAAVLGMIRTSPTWPRPGEFLSDTPRSWTRGCAVKWRRVTDRRDGKHEFGYQTIATFLKSNGVCGTYGFNPDWVQEKSTPQAELFDAVWEEEAFPGLFTETERENILERHAARGPTRSDAAVPQEERGHLLPEVRCRTLLPDGSPCNRRMTPTMRPDRTEKFRYFSPTCSIRGHSSSAPPTIEGVVFDLIGEAYSKPQMEALFEEVEIDQGLLSEQTKALARELRLRKEAQDNFVDLAAEAQRKEDGDVVDVLLKKLAGVTNDVRILERRLRVAEQERQQALDLGEADLLRLKDLASDVPRVLTALRGRPKEYRKLVSLLVRRVAQTRICEGLIWCEIDLPGGRSIGAPLFTRTYSATAPQVSGLASLIAAEGGRTPTNAKELAKLNGVAMRVCERVCIECGPPRGVWALLSAGPPSKMVSKVLSLDELAEMMDVHVGEVERALVRGKLGESWVLDGSVFVAADIARIHAEFPNFARREVARAVGLDEVDLLEASLVARSRSQALRGFVRLMKRGGGLHLDKSSRPWIEVDKVPGKVDLKAFEIPPPPGKSAESGCWSRMSEAIDALGCRRRDLKKLGILCRPGGGVHGVTSVLIWVDADLEAKVRTKWRRRHGVTSDPIEKSSAA